MKVAVIYNKREVHSSDVINLFGPQTKERFKEREPITKFYEQVQGIVRRLSDAQHGPESAPRAEWPICCGTGAFFCFRLILCCRYDGV